MAPQKNRAKLISRIYLNEYILEASVKLQSKVEFKPGQFANLLVADKKWRSYSITELEDNIVKFIVDIRPGGPGSIFFRDGKIGSEIECLIPMGRFILKDQVTPKLMIATGTGIVPFIPMSRSLLDTGFNKEITLLWGIRYDHDYYIDKYLDTRGDRLNIITAMTQPRGKIKNIFHGRVSDLLKEVEIDLSSYDCYICGNPDMVREVREILTGMGAQSISTEKY